MKCLFYLSMMRIQERIYYLLTIFDNFLSEISALCIQEVTSRKNLLLTYLQFFHSFLNEVSALCIQDVTSGKSLLLAHNFFYNLLNEISALHIQEVKTIKSLLLTCDFFIISGMKYLYCISKR